MSEMINNREHRQKVLKEIIKDIHQGQAIGEVKARFEKLIQGVSVNEISEMEKALIAEGMPVEEIQGLCDVHAAVFKGSIEEIHRAQKPEDEQGHPVYTFKLENRELEKLINDQILPRIEQLKATDNEENIQKLQKDFGYLWEIDKHYSRKENLLFPYMEKHGITAPPKVMWGVDDEIREEIKAVRALLSSHDGIKDQMVKRASHAADRVMEMIFKEENILFPMVLETLAEDEWLKIAEESDEVGYCLIKPQGLWKPVRENVEAKVQATVEKATSNGYIKFDTGILNPEEISAIFNTLPLDITFVDKNGEVKFFSQGKERIFVRAKTVIGRKVENCHPPASVHIVEKIVEDLKSGKKDNEDFWIKMGDKYVHIRYFAVRDDKGEFLGVMEVTQNIKPIQEITGEKRLMSE